MQRDATSNAIRRYRTISVFAASAVLAFCSSASAQVSVTETFDVGTGTRFNMFVDNNVTRTKPGTLVPSENPADEELINDPFIGERPFVSGGNIITNQFGLTYTQNAGGAGAGEFGGEFNWFNYGGVADSNLGGQLNHSQEVVIKAKVRLDDIGFDNDQRITLGYYDLPASPTAIDFERGRISAGVAFVGGARALLTINGAASDPINIPGGYDEETGLTSQFDVDLTLKFDGTTAWFEGTMAGIPINNFTFSRAADATHPFDAFAISQTYLREQVDAFRRGVAWIDDLTYSVVADQGIDNPNPVRLGSPPTVGNGGDYNDDGEVNAADYVVWRKNFGATGSPGSVLGDGTSDDLLGAPDGDVDQFDYDFWKSRFGNSVPGAAAGALTSANVPEPSTGMLVLVAMLALPSWLRFRS